MLPLFSDNPCSPGSHVWTFRGHPEADSAPVLSIPRSLSVRRVHLLSTGSGSAGPSTFPAPSLPHLQEEEYSDGEDQHASVTIVEDFDMDTSTALPFLADKEARDVEAGPSSDEEDGKRGGGGGTRAFGPKPKMQSGAKRKNKSGSKTLLRGTKKMLEAKSRAKAKGGGDREAGGSSKPTSKVSKKNIWRGQ